MNLLLKNIKNSLAWKSCFWVGLCLMFSTFMLVSSCKKWAETPIPTDQVAENAVYTNDATAISVLTAMYSSMNTGPFQGSISSTGSISLFAGLSSDEYKLAKGITEPRYLGYYQNALSQSGTTLTGGEHWAPLYNMIFKTNAAITGLTSSSSLTTSVKQQLLGEAEFMRAFIYFYMVNEFGDVPLVLTTDPKANTLLAKSTKAELYQQIISDLLDAKEKLGTNYLDGTLLQATTERVRPTKWAAEALLSRVYLYTQTPDFTKAEAMATDVINNASLFNLAPLNSVFLKNSKEAIWQIQPTDLNLNTQEGKTLIIPATGPSSGIGTANPVYLSAELLNSFESGDQRAVLGNWINRTIYNLTPITYDTAVFAFKYKINSSVGVNSVSGLTEYFMVLRLGEQYLIRAEARAKQGNISGAQSDLNAIRNRAGLPNTTATDQSSLVTAILNERRHELFSEWGHRWFDLKRTASIDAVMAVSTSLKSNGAITWQSYKQLFPIPKEALNSSPNLSQNSGY